MKKMLSVIAICYSVYGVGITAFVFSKVMSVLQLIILDAGQGLIAFSRYMPSIAFNIIGILLAFFTFMLSILLIMRKRRIFCLALACIFLIEIPIVLIIETPIGLMIEIPIRTILGIFTIITLTSPFIKQEFKS